MKGGVYAPTTKTHPPATTRKNCARSAEYQESCATSNRTSPPEKETKLITIRKATHKQSWGRLFPFFRNLLSRINYYRALYPKELGQPHSRQQLQTLPRCWLNFFLLYLLPQ